MIGLIFIVAFGVYLLVSGLAIHYAYKFARRRGRNGTLWALGTAFAMYLVVFWDHIPTLLAHKYYCEKEAGFWVYKTIDQWKLENPGVMETLVYKKTMPRIQTPFGSATVLNERFVHVYRYDGPFLFNRWRIQTEIRDRKNEEVIARSIDFSTSQERRQAGWAGWKLWLDIRGCSTESNRDAGSFDRITAQFEGGRK